MPKEFLDYIDFWLQGQKQGFAGELPRKKLPDGSKMVALYEHPKLYIDRWWGSDLGGGNTILYILSKLWDEQNPLKIIGTPLGKLSYSGRIVRRFTDKEMERITKSFVNMSQSEIIWSVLKSALSQVTRERPFRGPEFYVSPTFSDLYYFSREKGDLTHMRGEEGIRLTSRRNKIFEGNYDFIIVKKNLED